MTPIMKKYFQTSNGHKDDFDQAGLIEIFNPIITAKETIISVILFNASALTAAS